MDGANRKHLVTSVHWPTGLAIDYPARRLYWVDPKTLSLESILLTGQDKHLVRSFKEGKKRK